MCCHVTVTDGPREIQRLRKQFNIKIRFSIQLQHQKIDTNGLYDLTFDYGGQHAAHIYNV